MGIENLHDFLGEYFTANQCEVLQNENGKLTIQLNEKMDEALMNRPFYWHYIKKIGRQGEPKRISFITNPDRREEDGEWIHFGSPRLHQIFKTLETQGRFTKLFETVITDQKTPLSPWLIVNIKLSYTGKQKKDEIWSIGLHLINGTMITNMMDHLHSLQLKPAIPDFCYTITPMIKMKSGYQRIISYIENHLQNQEHDWAQESWQNLVEEQKILEHFYVKTEEETDEDEQKRFEQEQIDINNRFQPVISIDVINGGIFYLSQQTSLSFIK